MPDQNTPDVRRFGWPKHRYYDGGVTDPLPKRWVDLIRQLNERDHPEANGRKETSVVERCDER